MANMEIYTTCRMFRRVCTVIKHNSRIFYGKILFLIMIRRSNLMIELSYWFTFRSIEERQFLGFPIYMVTFFSLSFMPVCSNSISHRDQFSREFVDACPWDMGTFDTITKFRDWEIGNEFKSPEAFVAYYLFLLIKSI